jgi:HK97 family phage portal protein
MAFGFFRRFLGWGSSGAAYRSRGIQYSLPTYSSKSAVPVTVDSSLQLSSAWACVKLISETVASLPIKVYTIDLQTGVRKLNPTHPLHVLFNGKVNRWQTRQEYFETLNYQIVLLGNNYSLINRVGDRIVSLTPLMSEQMTTELLDDGSIRYRYTDGATIRDYTEKDIWHNKLFGNGIIGLSPLAYARNSVGIAQGAEDSVGNIYRNGGKPSGVLEIDKVLTAEQREAIKSNFGEVNKGTEGRLFTLEAGMKFNPISLSPQDIELLASRKFQIEDIARFFGVPSVLINDTSAGTTWGSGIQQIVEGWYKLGLRPYLERYEASMKCRLLSPQERMTTDIEFDLNALLQPSMAERINKRKEAILSAQMTPNEARAEEGWQPKEGGDDLYMQQQNVPLGMLGELHNKTGLADNNEIR